MYRVPGHKKIYGCPYGILYIRGSKENQTHSKLKLYIS
jgi:hypothetical protein